MIVVRRVRPGEGDSYRQVRLAALAESPAAFASTYARESSLTAQDWSERARASAEGWQRAAFFAVDDGDIVGLVGGYRPKPASDVIELVSMWTHPSTRRTGVGRLLVEAVIEWARAGQAQEVQLWVTRANTAAQVFYRAVGFTETGEYQPLPSDPCRDESRMTFAL
ncbi:MAG: GNAT family N-acetyltransferase [Acidobacteriota bacterium]|nr:GNAT family N-acetyltransferase [Acidobacteriota bacterium]